MLKFGKYSSCISACKQAARLFYCFRHCSHRVSISQSWSLAWRCCHITNLVPHVPPGPSCMFLLTLLTVKLSLVFIWCNKDFANPVFCKHIWGMHFIRGFTSVASHYRADYLHGLPFGFWLLNSDWSVKPLGNQQLCLLQMAFGLTTVLSVPRREAVWIQSKSCHGLLRLLQLC